MDVRPILVRNRRPASSAASGPPGLPCWQVMFQARTNLATIILDGGPLGFFIGIELLGAIR